MANRPRARAQTTVPGPPNQAPPNILIVIVDQMRYPTVFPSGISDADMFLSRFMPNLYRGIWKGGVKFANHFTAATPCSPARGTLVTGLYSQQTWILENIGEYPYRPSSKEPWLDPRIPTYGKLLRKAGYQTPYVGKWHLSIPPQSAPRLDQYGFDGLTYYDPVGLNLEGTLGNPGAGFLNDKVLLNQAQTWLSASAASAEPWCLTVSFVNPHDIEFYWGGTEFDTFNRLFDGQTALAPKHFFSWNQGKAFPPVVSWAADPVKDPTSFGYPVVPANWESYAQLKANKPSLQAFARLNKQFGSGGISEDPGEVGFSLQAHVRPNQGIGVAPYSYWQRGLDCYTQLMGIVDQLIGGLLDAIPPSLVGNTVVVFTSDHGDYAGAHGFVTGKTGSVYDEAFHVPLIVFDPSGRLTGDVDTPRSGLTSSVDVLPMLVALASNGQTGWQDSSFAQIYADRHDMMSMLKSGAAAGRNYLLLASDTNDVGAPSEQAALNLHVLGLRTQAYKLGTYAQWTPGTTTLVEDTLETEFYDYTTPEGLAELANTPNDPQAGRVLKSLLGRFLPNEVRAPLPAPYADAQADAQQAYLEFVQHYKSQPQ